LRTRVGAESVLEIPETGAPPGGAYRAVRRQV